VRERYGYVMVISHTIDAVTIVMLLAVLPSGAGSATALSAGGGLDNLSAIG